MNKKIINSLYGSYISKTPPSTASTSFGTTGGAYFGGVRYNNRVLSEELIKEMIDERVRNILKLIADRIQNEDLSNAIKDALEVKDFMEKIDSGEIDRKE